MFLSEPTMPCRRHTVFLVILFLGVSATECAGQRVSSNSASGNVRVHVEFPDAHAAGLHLRVRLLSASSSTPISESFTNDHGATEFFGVPVGNYHIVVSGEGIQEADSGSFEIDRRKVSQSIYITVHPIQKDGAAEQQQHSVSKAELGIPAAAQKEFDRATKAMAGQDWAKALRHLSRAVDIYPDYAMAYNNLAVVYGHLNDPQRQREALQKAIDVDSHFAPGYVNLAKIYLRQQDAEKAETLLENANRSEPNNPETMTLLAQAQLLNKHFDAAIQTAREVHAGPHTNFAVAHYIAGRALQRSGRPNDAVAELQTFLTEEPTGPRADHVREELAKIQVRAE
jgi:tetratricopeptide (TPR) repeat protein